MKEKLIDAVLMAIVVIIGCHFAPRSKLEKRYVGEGNNHVSAKGSQRHNAVVSKSSSVASQAIRATSENTQSGKQQAPTGPKSPTTGAPQFPIDLNIADAEQLVALPGIGPSRAQAILRLRQKRGRFKRVSDLRRVRGIGYKTMRDLKPLVIVGKAKAKEEPKVAPKQRPVTVSSDKQRSALLDM